MNVGGKGAALSSLKTKMQSLRDEMDKIRDDLDQKSKECEALKDEKNKVLNLFHIGYLRCSHVVVCWTQLW